MPEIKSVVCPNCGANATNTTNCEYCGSLLVRFVEKGIDLSQTSYLNNDDVLPGLINHLKQNLVLQKEGKFPTTDIMWSWFDEYDCISVLAQKNRCVWLDKTEILHDDTTEGFLILLSFNIEDSDEQRMESQFRKLPSFKLFTQHTNFLDNRTYSEYAISFGQDVEGAARIISEILLEVKNWGEDDGKLADLAEYFIIGTNVGEEISQFRENTENYFKRKYGFSEDESQGSKWFFWVSLAAAVLVWTLVLIKKCS